MVPVTRYSYWNEEHLQPCPFFLPPRRSMPDLSQHQWEVMLSSTLPHKAFRLQLIVVQSFINCLKETSRGFFHLACGNTPQQEPKERAKCLWVMLWKDLELGGLLKSSLAMDKHSLVDMPSIPWHHLCSVSVYGGKWRCRCLSVCI